MKIVFNSEVLALQRYSCVRCGRGCRSFLVPVRAEERKSIEALRNWRSELGVEDLFVPSRSAGKYGYGLAKRADGSCVFLGKDNLCIIHKLHGLKAKPTACQLFPFVFTPIGGDLRVGLRFDCKGVCQNDGAKLTTNMADLRRLANEIVPPDQAEVGPPPVRPGVKVSVEQFDAINEAMLQIVSSNAVSIVQRLHWLRMFVDHLTKVKWANVADEDFDELVGLLKNGALAEVRQLKSERKVKPGKGRKLLGQVFLMLSHPPEIVHSHRKGLIGQIKNRIKTLMAMRQLGKMSGPLPKVQPDWPDYDMAELEYSFGDWPSDVEELLGRFMVCRIGGLNYCGPNFYNYSMVDGARSLILAMVTTGWLMRIEAVKAGRSNITLSDARAAMMIIDGNLGYAKALGTGPGRLRLRYLSDHLGEFIDWYCC